MAIKDVARALQSYADRGVFRAFSHTGATFRFTWLWNQQFRATFQKATLTFPNLLPGIPARSALERELKAFIKECESPDRPAHRRITTPVRCVRTKRSLSLAFKVNDEDGARQAVNLVNEVFLTFLSYEHPQYVVEHFRVGED